MKTVGVAKLLVTLGQQQSYEDFIVVESIFPRVFIGLRSQKSMNIKIDARNSRILVNKEPISFISKVESTYASVARRAVNGKQLIQGTEN